MGDELLLPGAYGEREERLELRVDVVVLLLREVADGVGEMRVLEQCVAWAERRVLSARASSVSACAEVHAVSGGTRHLHVVPDVSTFGRLLPVGGKLRRGLGLELLRCGDVHSNPGPRLGLSRRALGGVRPTSPLHPSATSRQHWETMSKNVQLNIGTLNVRGIGEAAKAAEVATEMCQQNLNILVLTETRVCEPAAQRRVLARDGSEYRLWLSNGICGRREWASCAGPRSPTERTATGR